MKMRPEVISQLKQLLPEELHASAWIAGGYAHDPEKAGDIDLWVVGQSDDLVAAANVIRKHLNISEMDDKLMDDPAYNEHPHGFRVAHLGSLMEDIAQGDGFFGGRMREVQVIVTRQPSIDALLSYFDITTHSIAYSLIEPEKFKVGEGYFPIGAQPRVKRWGTPEQTLQRLEKICNRYGFEPHPEDVQTLEALSQQADGWREVAA